MSVAKAFRCDRLMPFSVLKATNQVAAGADVLKRVLET